MSLYDDYESYVDKYQAEYGPRTVVAYQCGGFYEIYSINDGKVDIKEVSELLNIQVSKRNKTLPDISRSNSLMAGWPQHAMNKFLPILIDNNFTVVIVDQVTPPPNPKRAVTQVLSKGTFLEQAQTPDSRYVACYLFDEGAIGITVIDVSTGQSTVYETYAKQNDSQYPMDEAMRISMQYKPCEVILASHDKVKSIAPSHAERLVIGLGLSKAHCVNMLSKLPNDVSHVAYQNSLISRVFPYTKMLSPIEYVNLERHPYALASYVCMLRYLERHNESLITKLAVPEYETIEDFLILSHNAAEQLEVDGLLKILNQSVTAMGRRFFKERLLHPVTNSQQLQSSYDKIHCTIERGLEHIRDVRLELKKVYDIERLYRKAVLKRLHPTELFNIHSSLLAVKTVVSTLETSSDTNEIEAVLNHIDKTVDINACLRYTLDDMIGATTNPGTFFKRGFDIEVDQAFDDVLVQRFSMEALLSDINDASGTHPFKLDETDRDGLYLTCTSKRFQEVKNKLQNFTFKHNQSVFDFTQVKVTQQASTTVKIFHPFLDELTRLSTQASQSLERATRKAYNNFIEFLTVNFEKEFKNVCFDIKQCDFQYTCAYNAITFRYSKPCITSSCSRKAFVECKDLRHPIVERIQEEIPYVANDVSLGSDTNADGLLLYGLNAAGKSTLMKSIAIAVWMAQAGMYVPASEMRFKPYTSIFSRITRGDNIYLGKSTFMVEMAELRNILYRCDENSLIIGDELCSGTESASAIGIVTAGLAALSKKQASFVFATHLHDLTNISIVKSISNLEVKHLHVEYDPLTKALVYDRKLRNGQGMTTYGIEVCRSLDIGKEFIDMANSVRSEYLSENTCKQSHYNAKCLVKQCSVCQSQADEVHHILQQKDADSNGFISFIHKNRLSNLVALCEKCHDDVHNKVILIKGYVLTSDGIKLNIEKEKALTEEDSSALVGRICKMRFEEKLSISNIAKTLNITQYQVKKAISSRQNL